VLTVLQDSRRAWAALQLGSVLSNLLVPPMTAVTHILSLIEQGNPHAAEQLLPLVYDELRRLAARGISGEPVRRRLDHQRRAAEG
jgi:hypothetical protein